MFLTLFTTLYDEPENKFEWEKFKKLGLLHYNGEDFVTRLANINFRDMPEEQYHNLLKLRNDEQFKEVCENSAYAYDIVDLADWVDYVCEGQKISIEKKQCERDYDKIKADKEKRGGKSMQLKEDFINEALTDIDKYQNNLMNLQSELRTLMIGVFLSWLRWSPVSRTSRSSTPSAPNRSTNSTETDITLFHNIISMNSQLYSSCPISQTLQIFSKSVCFPSRRVTVIDGVCQA